MPHSICCVNQIAAVGICRQIRTERLLLQNGRMLRKYSELEGLTGVVLRCAIEVHRLMGPGLLESVYQECLAEEFQAQGVSFARGLPVTLRYKERPLHSQLFVDLLVEDRIVVEVKSVEGLNAIHQAQVITYLKLTGCPVGLLINFNEILLKHGIRRLDRPDIYRANRALRQDQ